MFRSAFNWLGEAAHRVGNALSLRRWEAAETSRLNQAHWQKEVGNSVNEDLAADRETIVKRSMLEIENNPFAEGVCASYVSAVVGTEGPALQVQSDDATYNEKLEWLFWNWWQAPEITGQIHGVDLLQQIVRLMWSNGEFLFQEVDDASAADGSVSYRLNQIHPRRLRDPLKAISARSRIMMGVERDTIGRIVRYYISDFESDEYGLLGANWNPVGYDADRMIHGFKPLEPGQVRGVPWLAPCLQTIADLRDADKQILDAIRLQADFAVILYTENADAPFKVVNQSTTIKRRTISAAPPGYKPMGLSTTQPAPDYLNFRREKLRELGRPVNMPLMMVMLDSGDHTYSSARFDGQLFNRGVQSFQAWLDRVLLNRCVARIERQALLNGTLGKRPENVVLNWTWPVAPHVDPQKEAEAWATLLAINGCSEYDVAAALGKDFETIVAARQKAAKLLSDAGLPPTKSAADLPTKPVEKDAGKPSASGKKDKQVA